MAESEDPQHLPTDMSVLPPGRHLPTLGPGALWLEAVKTQRRDPLPENYRGQAGRQHSDPVVPTESFPRQE